MFRILYVEYVVFQGNTKPESILFPDLKLFLSALVNKNKYKNRIRTVMYPVSCPSSFTARLSTLLPDASSLVPLQSQLSWNVLGTFDRNLDVNGSWLWVSVLPLLEVCERHIDLQFSNFYTQLYHNHFLNATSKQPLHQYSNHSTQTLYYNIHDPQPKSCLPIPPSSVIPHESER